MIRPLLPCSVSMQSGAELRSSWLSWRSRCTRWIASTPIRALLHTPSFSRPLESACIPLKHQYRLCTAQAAGLDQKTPGAECNGSVACCDVLQLLYVPLVNQFRQFSTSDEIGQWLFRPFPCKCVEQYWLTQKDARPVVASRHAGSPSTC